MTKGVLLRGRRQRRLRAVFGTNVSDAKSARQESSQPQCYMDLALGRFARSCRLFIRLFPLPHQDATSPDPPFPGLVLAPPMVRAFTLVEP